MGVAKVCHRWIEVIRQKAVFLLVLCSSLLQCGDIFAQSGSTDYSAISGSDYSKPRGMETNMLSPNVSSLGIFGDIPISPYTGHPQINLPLMKLVNNGAVVPFTLSYNLTAVRPDLHPSWTGLGWNLNVAGVISRKIRDEIDEHNEKFYNVYLPGGDAIGPKGFYSNPAAKIYVQSSDWETALPPFGYTAAQLDTEPDEFAFSCLDISGKFFLDQDNNWRVRSDREIRVEFDGVFVNPPFPIAPPKTQIAYPNIPALRAFRGFILTDDRGIKYYFGGSNDAIEYNINFLDQNHDDWVATSWHLTKILWPDGKQATFSYERGKFVADLRVIYNESNTQTYTNGNAACRSIYVSDPVGGQVISPLYLREIRTSWGDIVQLHSSSSDDLGYSAAAGPLAMLQKIYSVPGKENQLTWFTGNITQPDKVGWRKLDSISWNSGGNLLKRFRFAYNSRTSHMTPLERLMLGSLTEVSSNGVSQNPFYFKYSLDGTLTDKFPAYLSELTDHWGYYSNKKSSWLSLKEAPDAYYLNREPSSDRNILHANLLTEIVYPTGGSTQFLYEQGEYGSSLDSSRTRILQHGKKYGGSPRIKSITDVAKGPRTSASTLKRRIFYYVKGYRPGIAPTGLPSSGILSGIPKYQYRYDERYTSHNTAIRIDYKILTTNPVMPLVDEIFDNPIGYSEVTEMQTTSTDLKTNGYTISKYTSFDDGHFDDATAMLRPAFFPNFPTCSRAFERGRMKLREVYDAAGKLQESVETSWGNRNINGIGERDRYVKGYLIKVYNRCEKTNPTGSVPSGASFGSMEIAPYRIYYYPFRPLKEIVTSYSTDGSGPLTSNVTYSYVDGYRLLREKSVTGSSGETYRTSFRYPMDVPRSTGDIYTFMTDSNYLSYPIETVQSIIRGTVENVISADITDFAQKSIIADDGKTRNIPLPVISYVLENTVPVPKSAFVGLKFYDGGRLVNVGPDMRMRQAFSYDSKGNISSVDNLTSNRMLASRDSYIWDDRRNRIAEVKNSERFRMALEDFENWADWIYDDDNLISVAHTGTRGLSLSGGKDIRTRQKMPAGRYSLSYWSRGGSPVLVKPTNNPSKALQISEQVEPSTGSGGWTLHQILVSLPVEDYVYLFHTGTTEYQVDDIRLVPEGAEATTYTYEQGRGVSSVIDPKGDTRYYEYDNFLRLKNIRDNEKNILRNIEYNYFLKPL